MILWWWREIIGWVLVGIGLITFAIVYFNFLRPQPPEFPVPRLFESVPLTFIGFVVFRGGIHLVKTATAARICLEAGELPDSPRTTAATRPVQPINRPGSRRPQRVGPGPAKRTP
jgi:hypothetical protein